MIDGLTPGVIGAFLVAFARVAGVVATAPVLGDATTPVRVRLAAAISLTLVVMPVQPERELGEVPGAVLLALATGIMIGLTARFVYSRVAIAGQLIGLSLGLGFASDYDPRAGESASAVRALLVTLAGLAFVTTGGIEAIAKGAMVGAGEDTIPFALAGGVLDHGAAAFGAGLELAMPVVIAALVGNVGLALMNRAAPAVNVFSISLAAILLIGGIALWITAPATIVGINAAVRDTTDVLSQVAR